MGQKTTPSSHRTACDAGDAAGRTRRWQPYLFRFAAATLVPLVLLAVLELALRAFGFGCPTGAIIKSHMNSRKVYTRSIRFGWRFFPANISREWDPSFVLPVKKAVSLYRSDPKLRFMYARFLALGVGDKAGAIKT